MRSSILLAGLVTLIAMPELNAADCTAEVDRLATRYRVSVDLPQAAPPRAGTGAMPTTPNIPPQTAARPSTRPTEMSAAKRTPLQSLLTAAKAAAGQPQEAECFQPLSQAQALTESDLQ